MIKFNIYLLLIVLFVSACESKEVTEKQAPKEEPISEEYFDSLAFDSILDASIAYTQNRDLDGDGISDEIYFDFTNGAHCCYLLSLDLSSSDGVIDYPFEMDGGYVMGVDGSMPNHFQINDFDEDGLPEIYMEIYTYNAEITAIEGEWTKEYGITTNYILFDYKDGKMEVRDYILTKE